MTRLTGTSFAVLALLARRPYSAYELTTELKASMAQCMPRSATLLYREPKNLVSHGLAGVDMALKGRQKRAVYSITEAGRAALADWFTRPAAPPVFECEAVQRVLFGHLGHRADVAATLGEFEDQVRILVSENLDSMPAWFEHFPPPTEHLADVVVLCRLYADLYEVLINWAQWARAQIADRPAKWSPEHEQEIRVRLQELMGQARELIAAPAEHAEPATPAQ